MERIDTSKFIDIGPEVDVIVGAYVANTNELSPYAGRPGLIIGEPFVDGEDTRVRVAWIDGPTNVTVREPVIRILAGWEGVTPLAVDAAVIEDATRGYLAPW